MSSGGSVTGGTRARVHLRRGRLVAADADPSGAGDEGAARIAQRRGKLVRLRPSIPGAVSEPVAEPAADPATGTRTGRVETALITIFILTLLVPVSWPAGPLRLTPYLVFLVIGFVPLVGLWLARSKTQMMLPDFMMLIFCCWSSAALGLNGGWGPSGEPIGIQWLTTFGAYLAGRLLVRDPRSMRWMVTVMAVIAVTLLPLLIVEALTGAKPLLKIASMLGRSVPALHIGQRFGLERAQGPFEHPIAAGIFMASMFSPVVYVIGGTSLVRRILAGIVTAMAAICSVSTAALLSLNTQLGLMLWSRVFRAIRHRWRILTALLITVYVVVDMLSTATPFHVFVNYATLSHGSSYNRIIIWQYGSAEALRHPFFGIGMNDWTRPRWMSSSMDNFWLLQAVRYGIPSFLLLAGAVVALLWRMGRIEHTDTRLILIRRAMTFSIIGTMITVCSAHLWNAAYVWFMFFVGSAGWLASRQGTAAGSGPDATGKATRRADP